MYKKVTIACILFIVLGAKTIFPMQELSGNMALCPQASSSSGNELENILRQSGIEGLSEDTVPKGLICVLREDSAAVEEAKVTSFFDAYRLRYRTSAVKVLLDNSSHLLDKFEIRDFLQYIDAYKGLMSGEDGSGGLMWPMDDRKKRNEAIRAFSEKSDLLHGLALSMQKSECEKGNDSPVTSSVCSSDRIEDLLCRLFCKSCISSGNCFKCGASLTEEDGRQNEQASKKENGIPFPRLSKKASGEKAPTQQTGDHQKSGCTCVKGAIGYDNICSWCQKLVDRDISNRGLRSTNNNGCANGRCHR